MKLRRPRPRAMYVTKRAEMYTAPLRRTCNRRWAVGSRFVVWHARASRSNAAVGREANTRRPAKEHGLKPSARPARATTQVVTSPDADQVREASAAMAKARPIPPRIAHAHRLPNLKDPDPSRLDREPADHRGGLLPATAHVAVPGIRARGGGRGREHNLAQGLRRGGH